jgi:hypothetical protein
MGKTMPKSSSQSRAPSRIKITPSSATFTGPRGLKIQAKIENHGEIPGNWPARAEGKGQISRSRIMTVKEVQEPSAVERVNDSTKRELENEAERTIKGTRQAKLQASPGRGSDEWKARRSIPHAKLELEQAEAALGYRDEKKYPTTSPIGAADRAILKVDVDALKARLQSLEKGEYVPEPDFTLLHEQAIASTERKTIRNLK